MRFRWIVAIFALSAAAPAARAEDWPRWRGPHGDGISRDTTLADTWPAAVPKVVWSAKVGQGYASPIAVDGVIY